MHQAKKKVKEIIENLLSYNCDKESAANEICELIENYRNAKLVEFEVMQIQYGAETNHAIIELLSPYGYYLHMKHIQKGDYVDVMILP